MSIIHDALKKVQQSLAPKTDEKEINPSTATEVPGNLYATAPTIETLPRAGQEAANEKPPMKNKIKTILILACALIVIAGSIFYIFQRLKGNTHAAILAKKTFYKLIHKEDPPPDFKTKAPADLKPMAQLTISTKASAPVTLNVHGIMANGTSNLVLINDQVYQEGDEVDGAKIIKINLNSITVNINGTEQTIVVKN